jgi:hypothetical protein
MSGIKIKLPKNTKIDKGGKITIPPRYRDASHAIASKKSPKQKYVRPTR